MADNKQWRVGDKFYRKRRKAWYCKLEGPNGERQERKLLKGPNDKETADDAERARQNLRDQIEAHGTPTLDCTVDHLVQSFLTYVEANNAHGTYRNYAHFLLGFAESPAVAGLKVRQLELRHANDWLAKHYPIKGNKNTRHDAIVALKRLFNWAVRDMKYLPYNPLAGLSKPKRTHRQVCPTMDQWNQVLAHYAGDPFGDFLTVLVDTGARPQELRVTEARQLDLDARPPVIVYDDGEIPGKALGRKVQLTPRAVTILRRYAGEHPEGPVMRNERGDPWKKDALNCRFQRLKRAKTFPFRVNCYAARHSLATDLLDKGASVAAVQALLGHRDPRVVLEFYGKHISERTEHLQGLLEKTRPADAPRMQLLTEKDFEQGDNGSANGHAADNGEKKPKKGKRDAG
jgi:site-specific recombinase XerD